MTDDHAPSAADLEADLTSLFAAEPRVSTAASIDEKTARLLAASTSAGPQVSARTTLTFAVVVVLAMAAIVTLPRSTAPIVGIQATATSSHWLPALITRHQEAYPLDTSPAAMATFTGNTNVVVATLESVGGGRWTGSDHEGRDYIYSPVSFRVDVVYRGTLRPGDIITIRQFGGTSGNTQMRFDEAVPVAELDLGSRTLLFFGSAADAGDGIRAFAANAVYRVDASGIATSYPDATYSLPLIEFGRQIAP